MSSKVIFRYILGALAIVAVSVGLTIMWHGELKSLTPFIMTWAPILFALNVFIVFGFGFIKGRRGRMMRRAMVIVTMVCVFVPWAILKAEVFGALVEWRRGTTPEQAIAMIKSTDNVARYRAWSTVVTLNTEEREELAKVAALGLVDEDPAVRESFILTFDNPLRKFKLIAISALTPYLKDTPNPHAVAFVQRFIRKNAPTISSYLDPKKSGKIANEETLNNLLFSLKFDSGVGHMLLTRFSESDNERIRTLARRYL